RIQAERMEKIAKIQSEFTTKIIQSFNIEQIDGIEKNLLSFEVTDGEFGDLKMACEQTISGIQLDINIARTRIEDEIWAEKQRILSEAKASYRVEAGKEWKGVEDAELIGLETKKEAAKNYRAELLKRFEMLGGELPKDIRVSIKGLEKLIEAKQIELAEFAKQKKADEKKAAEAKRQMGKIRLLELMKAGILDLDWAAKIQANDYPDLLLEDLTEDQFNTFKDNLVAIQKEIPEVDFEETTEKEGVKYEIEGTVDGFVIGKQVGESEKVRPISSVAEEKSDMVSYLKEFYGRAKIQYVTKTVAKIHADFQTEFNNLIAKYIQKLT
ncbi:MAG: hypothetical protein KAR20_20605, partial [Candidatus Heimdallarchaeota archaeon]|nr:hypothetical protein [Candidatus Heimdallarchaeota archaeon]